MGPPVVTRRWHAATIKAAIADDALGTLGEVPADASDDAALAVATRLRELGWKKVPTTGGFAAGQPQYNFWVPLAGDDGAKSEDDVLAAMNQQWRRNIKKSAKAGVEVTRGKRDDLAAFHAVYAETAERDHFTPRPLSYFERMWDALGAEEPDRMTLYLAHHEGDLVAATTLVRVGTHAWYSYGASTTEKRDVRGSNAVQWQMMRDALAAGADVYDMRGITDTLDADDPHIGLIQFKVGTGGDAVEYLGEWDLPLNRALYLAFTAYMRRRSRMTFSLHVDAARWRSHLAGFVEATPGIVPVVKGNGYGLGRDLLAAESSTLGCPTLAVGTYAEVPDALAAFGGDVMVLSPWRPFLPDVIYDARVVHTVGRVADVEALAARGEETRVVVEGETSMARHGFDRHELAAVAAALGDLRVEGFAVHLPMAGSNLIEAESWAAALEASQIETDTFYVSHLTGPELAELSRATPEPPGQATDRHLAVAGRPGCVRRALHRARPAPGVTRRTGGLPAASGAARRIPARARRRHQPRARPRGAAGPGQRAAARQDAREGRPRGGRVRAEPVLRRRQAALVRRAAAHAGQPGVPARLGPCTRGGRHRVGGRALHDRHVRRDHARLTSRQPSSAS